MPLVEADLLLDTLQSIRPDEMDGFFFRMLPIKYVKSPDSVEGARRKGARYNPPLALAAKEYGLKDGFGLLYTATNPITCHFECRHILRGAIGSEYQVFPVEPALLITFNVSSSRVLNLTDLNVQSTLGLTHVDLVAPDSRFVLNAVNTLTPLQWLGVLAYQTGRFAAILAPSAFDDVVPSHCFNFLTEVRFEIQDVEEILSHIALRG